MVDRPNIAQLLILHSGIGGPQILRYDFAMDQDEIIERLRRATEDDVTRALADAYVQFDRPAADLLEFFKRMIDVIVGEEET